MRKIKLLLFACTILFSKVFSQDLNVTDHTKLFYKFTEFDKAVTYEFTIKSLTPSIVYEWGNSNKEDNNGSGIITEEAISNAINLFYFYTDSDRVTLYDRTPSFFISKKVFNELKNSGKSRIRLQDNENTNTLELIGTEEFEITLNKDLLKKEVKKVFVLHVKIGGEAGYEIWILDNPDFPLVMKLHAFKDYELKEVK